MTLLVLVYPLLAQALCACPIGATSAEHALIHSKTDAQDSVKPCHQTQDAKSSDSHHSNNDECCSIRTASFDLAKSSGVIQEKTAQVVEMNLSLALVSLDLILSARTQLSFYVHDPSRWRLAVLTLPLFKQHHSFLI